MSRETVRRGRFGGFRVTTLVATETLEKIRAGLAAHNRRPKLFSWETDWSLADYFTVAAIIMADRDLDREQRDFRGKAHAWLRRAA